MRHNRKPIRSADYWAALHLFPPLLALQSPCLGLLLGLAKPVGPRIPLCNGARPGCPWELHHPPSLSTFVHEDGVLTLPTPRGRREDSRQPPTPSHPCTITISQLFVPQLASPLTQRQQALSLQLPGMSPPPILSLVTGHPMDLSSILH